MLMVDEKRRDAASVGRLPQLPPGTVAHVAEPLEREPQAPARARCRLREWCSVLAVPDDIAYDLGLAASELVTNTLTSGAAPVWLRLAVARSLTLDVYDAGPVTPRLRDALARGGASESDLLATGGRGLNLVLALAEVTLLADPVVGKTVRAAFGLPHGLDPGDPGPGRSPLDPVDVVCPDGAASTGPTSGGAA